MKPTLKFLLKESTLFFFACFVILFSCKPDDLLQSSENNIISIGSTDQSITLLFNEVNKLIQITIPFDYTSDIIPVSIKISQGANHSLFENSIPISATSQITVIAEDGTVKTYKVEVIRGKNNQNVILDFSLEIEGIDYLGIINNDDNTIEVNVPTQLDYNGIHPQLTLSPNATIEPNLETELDFENEIKFTVKSESGIERIYTLILIENESDENFVTNFKFPIGEDSFIEGVIHNETDEIEVSVPYQFNLEAVVPIVEISPKASISFVQGTIFNFENLVTFLVTAENGEERSYKVVVTVEANTSNYILSFSFNSNQNEVISATTINSLENVILIEVPFNFSLSSVTPAIEISENASISPDIEQSQNFENPFKYTVTSENGISRIYTIITSFEKSNENLITEMTIPNGDETLVGLIDQENNKITFEIPFSYNLSNVIPSIKVSDLATLSPLSEVEQDFENETHYTVIAENGEERIYSIQFLREPNTEGDILEYKVVNGNQTYFATIDTIENIINLEVPFSFDYENATVFFDFSDNATVIGSGNNLYEYKYLVISESGNRKVYTMNFERGQNTENFINSFLVTINNENFQGIIDNENNTITLELPLLTESTETIPVVSVSENALFYPNENSRVELNSAIYHVISESGETRSYNILLEFVESSNNLITDFSLTIENQIYFGVIDNDNNEIHFTIPEGKDLTNLTPNIEYHHSATLFPSETESQNFGEEVIYSVVAENNDLKNYTIIINEVNLNSLENNFSITCDQYTNFSQWFGGESRAEFYPRNVGAGQAIRLDNDVAPSIFSIYLTGPFANAGGNLIFPNPMTIKLTIRNSDGSSIATQNTNVSPSFTEGWVDFNLSSLDLILQKDKTYIFTMYVPDGENLLANTGIRGGTNVTDSGICYQAAYAASYTGENPVDLDDWDSWYVKGYNNVIDTFFNFRLIGKQ